MLLVSISATHMLRQPNLNPHLPHRRNIINEIMQATAINNLKKAKGMDVSKDSTPQGPGKGDLLQVCGEVMGNIPAYSAVLRIDM